MKNIFIISICIIYCAQPIMAQDILNAVLNGNTEEVNRLLKKNPNLINTKDEYGNNLLCRAILKENIKMAECLLKNGMDVNAINNGSTALHIAVDVQLIEMVKLFLVDYGADINKRDTRGNTPLNYAVYRGNKEIAYYLLDKGALLNTEGFNIEGMVRSALTGGMERIIDQLLKENTVDYDNKNSSGNSFLHAAAEGGVISFAGNLIEKGVQINEKNIYGWAPLHYAASKGQNAMIDFLVNRGADKNIRTADGKTAYNIAEEFNQKETIRFLRQKGFDTSGIRFPDLRSKYIDPVLPESSPLLFAAGIVSKSQTFEHCPLTFTSDFNAVCWADWNRRGVSKIFLMERKNGQWRQPQIVLLHATNPCIAPDGSKIFFTAKRTLTNGAKSRDNDMFYIKRKGNGWGEPVNLGPNVNSENDDSQPSVTKDGTIYFRYDADIYRSKCVNGKYAPKEKLPKPINTETGQGEPFISQGGSFLIFRSLGPGGMREPNVYISFHNPDDTWTNPINLAKKIKIQGIFPSVTPDRKYLFYFDWDYYWVDAKIIDELKPKELK